MEAEESPLPVPSGTPAPFLPPLLHHGPVTHEHPQVPGTRQPHGAILLRAAYDQHCPLFPRQRGQRERLRHNTAGRLDEGAGGGALGQRDGAAAERWSVFPAEGGPCLAPSPSAVCLLRMHLGHIPTSLAQLLQKGEKWGDPGGMSTIRQEWRLGHLSLPHSCLYLLVFPICLLFQTISLRA